MDRKAKRWTPVSLCALILTYTGCQQNNIHKDKELEGNDKNSKVIAQNKTQAMPAEISVDEQISGAKSELASRLGIDLGTISVKEARSVKWGSGALGCPRPGMSYTQAIIPGVLVMLEAGGTVYRYHGRLYSKMFFCPDDRAQEPAYGPGVEVM